METMRSTWTDERLDDLSSRPRLRQRSFRTTSSTVGTIRALRRREHADRGFAEMLRVAIESAFDRHAAARIDGGVQRTRLLRGRCSGSSASTIVGITRSFHVIANAVDEYARR